jgi:hypothetical protein
MSRAKVGRGGGIGMSKIVHPPIRTGDGSHSTRPGYVSQLGNKVGSHATREGDTGYRGEKMHDERNFNPVKFGNELATNVKGGGCGTGRTLYGQCGTQGTHGAVEPGDPRPNTQREAHDQE